ncbi:MAG: endolytic transglycosylase MltG [Pseudorhodoplanes sp.]
MPPQSPRAAIEPERLASPKRKRSQRAKHPIVIVGNAIFTIVLVLALALGAVAYWVNQRFEQPGPLPEDKVVNIPRGLGVRDIAELLAREGVIRDPWVFVAGSAVMKARGADLKFGEYQFTKGASPRDVAETLVEGKVVQHQFTVAEGLTSEQIVARLLENDKLTGNIREVPREGSLLPDGYRFTRGTTRDEMIKRMQAAQARLLKEAWDRRVADLPVKSPEQLLVLASIIEKETGKPDERTRVAAVFVNRLKSKMKLQSDPTIIYGLVGGKGSLGRGILKSEITQPTPYNTYVIEGLPPGPIANPGRASIEAAANPARTKELFFVADGTGGHAFSETYDQHQKHVAKLRGIERDARDAAAEAAANAPAASPSAAPQARQPAARPAAAQQQPARAPAAQPAQTGTQQPAQRSPQRQGNTQQQGATQQDGAAQRSQTAPATNAPRTQ